jgi:hypothetical protein
MSDSTIQELEANIKVAREALELGNALERLFSNRDFKKVISIGYFEKEAVRLVHLKASAECSSPAEQQSIVSKIDAIGSFSNYFKNITTAAALARKTLDADEQTRDEIIFEGLNNG